MSVSGNRQTDSASTTGAFAAPASSENGASGTAPTIVSPNGQEADSAPGVVDWIREAFRPRVQQDASKEDLKNPENKEQEAVAGEAATKTDVTPPGTRLVTEQELQRLVQGETDRREAKHRNDERIRTERELREKDPYKYAQLVAQREKDEEEEKGRTSTISQAVNENVSTYDRQVLDPLFLAVPEGDERTAIERGIGEHPEGPLVGRGEAAKKLIELIRKQGRSEGESEARRKLVNDDSFVKEILTRRGGQRAEPEVVSPVGAAQRGAGSADDMEGFIRGSRGRGITL